jgi:hypothetical protein
LELTAATLLTENQIPFEYEPTKIELIPSRKYDTISFERIGKQFKPIATTRSVSYTPDFVGKGWIIETKGMKTPDFQIKWKLFKKYLDDNNKEVSLFMPTNKKEIIQSINYIKNNLL